MARVFISPLLQEYTGGESEVVVSGKSLRQVIAALEERFPELAGHIREGDRLIAGLAASIDGSMTTQGLLASVGPESEIHFLPAIGGG